MHLVIARLQAGRRRVGRHELYSLIQQVARPDDGLEHVYVVLSAHGAELAFFVLQPTVAAAETAVAQLCRRVIADSPALENWLVEQCVSGLVPGGEKLLTGDAPEGGSSLPRHHPDS